MDRGRDELEKMAFSMARTLVHRGPDAQGAWSGDTVSFGHARLAIIDLSPQGLQPMTSANGRYTICFNGEIYNHPELRKKLLAQSVQLRGTSDTEAFLETIAEFGLSFALQSSQGMFAFSLWDAKQRKLTLGRDRLGEKPLYYGMCGKDLVFASELKAFRQHPEFQSTIDRDALSAFIKYKYVPTPLCIFSGFKKLQAASTVTGDNPVEVFQSEPDCYWRYSEPEFVDNACTDGLERLLLDTVGSQMRTDVPIGCFLSGGIDSSLITSLMQSCSEKPIETFTIGFTEKEYDESHHARRVAEHLGTRHTEWVIGEHDVLDLIDELPIIYDEPFGDSSQLPTTLLSRMTRKQVTVCLSGDGGDELFCGYQRYHDALKINNQVSKVPRCIRNMVGRTIDSRHPDQWSKNYKQLLSLLGRKQNKRFGDKLQIVSQIFQTNDDEELYDFFLSDWKSPGEIVLEGKNVSIVRGQFNRDRSFLENMMLNDVQRYLSDDIMVKVDRASMSASLESRAPLLDHKVYEYAMSIPVEDKFDGEVSKLPLRSILSKYVPDHIINRPKMGFGVPLNSWFRSELRDWCDDLLSEDRLKQDGFFEVEPIVSCWQSHRSGEADRQYELWSILSFQHWLNNGFK